MLEAIENVIKDFSTPHKDTRTHCFDIKVEKLAGDDLALSGRVLEEADFKALCKKLTAQFPALRLDTISVNILRRPDNPCLHVGVNLTGLFDTPTFYTPLASELLYGMELEILEEKDCWVYTRQNDDYLGWAYRPYLSDQTIPPATHLTVCPSIEIRSEPRVDSTPVSRLLGGSAIAVIEEESEWCKVQANVDGWVPSFALRAIADLPKTESARREQMVKDAYMMTGVPYLWGGNSGNGIDCSGFARLLHQWLGVSIPRDADMQCEASRPVEPPYQSGDLFFFAEDESGGITHVGISLGGWKMIHSSRSRNGVYVDDLEERRSLRQIFACAGTFLSI